ncbi:hypothetical protein [Solimicrobium silvestre]|uniref:Uncharacterized protein n=1 Tax=Solimicrobium silvestre TaxID=2099400 RepID=A0A2S9H0N5_9BURK|nr:hypothetical protein [Solimicrobium silvestre]PRC93539.1 hypothetical protein S2091_1926 [Solimicrobium silvestre]
MLMSAADVAFMKGEAAARPGDGPDMALVRASEYGYIVPGAQRTAFVQGFLLAIG